MTVSLRRLQSCWRNLGNTPVTECGIYLDEDFCAVLKSDHGGIVFEKGTPVNEVWQWFETQNPLFSVATAQGVADKPFDTDWEILEWCTEGATVRLFDLVFQTEKPMPQPALTAGWNIATNIIRDATWGHKWHLCVSHNGFLGDRSHWIARAEDKVVSSICQEIRGELLRRYFKAQSDILAPNGYYEHPASRGEGEPVKRLVQNIYLYKEKCNTWRLGRFILDGSYETGRIVVRAICTASDSDINQLMYEVFSEPVSFDDLLQKMEVCKWKLLYRNACGNEIQPMLERIALELTEFINAMLKEVRPKRISDFLADIDVTAWA